MNSSSNSHTESFTSFTTQREGLHVTITESDVSTNGPDSSAVSISVMFGLEPGEIHRAPEPSSDIVTNTLSAGRQTAAQSGNVSSAGPSWILYTV